MRQKEENSTNYTLCLMELVIRKDDRIFAMTDIDLEYKKPPAIH